MNPHEVDAARNALRSRSAAHVRNSRSGDLECCSPPEAEGLQDRSGLRISTSHGAGEHVPFAGEFFPRPVILYGQEK